MERPHPWVRCWPRYADTATQLEMARALVGNGPNWPDDGYRKRPLPQTRIAAQSRPLAAIGKVPGWRLGRGPPTPSRPRRPLSTLNTPHTCTWVAKVRL